MPVAEQGATSDRYVVIPRTAVFLRNGDRFLLIKGAPTKRLWPGRYNGIGGHIERGEDILQSAKRELLEETGLSADLWLCGTVLVDSGDRGVVLFVLTGESTGGVIHPSEEGAAEWVPFDIVSALPCVEDVPLLLDRIRNMKRGQEPFVARSRYVRNGTLELTFAN